MTDITLNALNGIIEDVAPLNCDAFSNFFTALSDITDGIEDYHEEEILLFLNETLNVISEGELDELSNSEKKSLIRFLNDLV